MSNVTNLNQFRKQKARADKRAQGDANAVKFGRTKAQKQAEDLDTNRAKSHLDQHKVDE
ncbi:DUF4169 domain-containing protein [Marivivens niveibacter]|uniref:DUF4169 domain-containing protein n=1 Tax=Marivivens niveibacter TaxID=1930667 RepID=A0A251X2W1_9RHOB|nr:DUF4169 family protein [Marivivens niveibacter]OUD10946.1 DUF4169 domain-containing protein [Marivivens niveibacter]